MITIEIIMKILMSEFMQARRREIKSFSLMSREIFTCCTHSLMPTIIFSAQMITTDNSVKTTTSELILVLTKIETNGLLNQLPITLSRSDLSPTKIITSLLLKTVQMLTEKISMSELMLMSRTEIDGILMDLC